MRLYEKSKPAGRDWQEEIRKAAESGILSKRKVYLWFLQKGKDIYTGKDIPLDELLNGNMYDTDHIYARSLTNDNSIKNNLVLVKKTSTVQRVTVQSGKTLSCPRNQTGRYL